MSDLRNELKEWERAFRAEHARDPTKDDIRAAPAIAVKYKEYAKLKAGKGKGPEKPASSKPAQPKAPPPPSNPFKTPTKPKPSRRAAQPAASTSTDGPGACGSPSKRLSSSKPPGATTSAPTFVLTNSPSKLRALAAAHSTSGSPNRPQSGAWASATLAPSESVAIPSPQKRAANPFASPQKGAFGELERAERERLRAKKRAERERRAQAGVLGAKATTQGAGWGAAGGRGTFARTDSVASSTATGMDLDEVDDFFSSQASASAAGGSQRLLAQLAKASPTRPPAFADDDEVFGPSPVKRPSGASTFGSGADPAAQPKRIFKPLVPDSPPPSLRPAHATSASAAAAPAKPRPFASSLPSSSLVPASSSASTARKRAPADAADADAALDDGDDDFYADALEEAEAALAGGVGGKKGKAKAKGKPRARAANGAGAAAKRTKVDAGAKGKGKARAAAGSDGEMDLDGEEGANTDEDEEVRVVSSSRAGELVLDVEREEVLGGGRERLVIHEKGWRERMKAQEREERRRRAEQAGEGDEGDAVNVLGGGSSDEDDLVDEVSLFHQRRPVDLLARQRAEASAAPAAASHDDAADNADARRRDLEASLPADLAAVLSLRASPQKSQTTAKERQVARLLGEPATRKKQRGLLELAGEGAAEAAGEGAEEAEEGDDDWDEEPDGWKATGDAMDGYYSSDGW